MLTPYDATKDVTAVLDRLGAEAGGRVHVESCHVSMPRTFGDAILTKIRRAGPGADLRAINTAVRSLPGTLHCSHDALVVVLYRSQEA